MTDLADLLKAVLENPDDDGLRLIYADALDEAGEHERAELIRVQVELAEAYSEESGKRHHTRYAYLLSRQHHLLSDFSGANVRRWLLLHREQELLDLDAEVSWRGMANHANGFAWHRGFIESVRIKANTWLHHADAILQEHPIREVTLTTWPELEYNHIHYPVIGYRVRGTKSRLISSTPNQRDYRDRDLQSRFALEVVWPNIVFHLPEVR